MTNILNKIFELCERHGFFRRINYPKLNLEMLKIESTGALLQQNLLNEWLNSIIISEDLSVFPSSDGISETFKFAKEMCLGIPPFGVAHYTQKSSQSLQDIVSKRQEKIDFQDYFESGTTLECCVFLSPADATSFFHRLQRERKMWWRKVSISRYLTN